MLRLDAWHGALSPMEVAFVRRLDAEHRLMVDYKYLDEVIDVLIREDATEQAIALRITSYNVCYTKLLRWARALEPTCGAPRS